MKFQLKMKYETIVRLLYSTFFFLLLYETKWVTASDRSRLARRTVAQMKDE
jgi:hypothetical protein